MGVFQTGGLISLISLSVSLCESKNKGRKQEVSKEAAKMKLYQNGEDPEQSRTTPQERNGQGEKNLERLRHQNKMPEDL